MDGSGCQAWEFLAISPGADPENSERRGRVPHSPPRLKTSLQPDCTIITTLKKRLEGLGWYKNGLEIPWIIHENTRRKEVSLDMLFFQGGGESEGTLSPRVPYSISFHIQLRTRTQLND